MENEKVISVEESESVNNGMRYRETIIISKVEKEDNNDTVKLYEND